MVNTKKDSKDEPQLKNLSDVKEEVIEHDQEISQLQKQVNQVKKQVNPDKDIPKSGLGEGEVNPSAPPVNPGALQKFKKQQKKVAQEDDNNGNGLEEGEVNPTAPPSGFV